MVDDDAAGDSEIVLVPPVVEPNSNRESQGSEGDKISSFMNSGSNNNSISDSACTFSFDDSIDPRARSRFRRYKKMFPQLEEAEKEDDDYQQAWRDVTVTQSSYTTHHDNAESCDHDLENNICESSIEREDLGFDREGSFCRDVDPEQLQVDYEEAAMASGFRDV